MFFFKKLFLERKSSGKENILRKSHEKESKCLLKKEHLENLQEKKIFKEKVMKKKEKRKVLIKEGKVRIAPIRSKAPQVLNLFNTFTNLLKKERQNV